MIKYTNEERKLLCNSMYVVIQTFNVMKVFICLYQRGDEYLYPKVYYKELIPTCYISHVHVTFIHIENTSVATEVFSKGFHSLNMQNVVQ